MKFFQLSSALCLLICFSAAKVLGQNTARIDSLTNAMEHSTGKEHVMATLQLCFAYADKENSVALRYAQQAFESALTLGDSALIVRTGRVYGIAQYRCDRVKECIATLTTILPIAGRNNLLEVPRIYNGLALAETFTANFDLALRYGFKALALRKKEGDKALISTVLTNIGLIYFKLEDNLDALKYYKMSLALKNEIGDQYNLSRLLINIALCENNFKNYGSARKHIKMAFDLCKDDCDKTLRIEGLFALGKVFRETGKTDSAIFYLKKTLLLSREQDNKRFQAEALNSLAKIYIKINKSDQAKSLLAESQRLAVESSYRQILDNVYESWSMLYASQGDFKQAYLNNKKHSELYSNISAEKYSDMVRVESEFMENENRQTIAAQAQILKLKEEVIQNHNLVFALGGSTTFLFLILIVYLFKQYRRKQRDNKLLDLKVQERTIFLKDSVRSLMNKMDEQRQSYIKSSIDLINDFRTLRGLLNIIRNDPTDIETLAISDSLILKREKNLSREIEKKFEYSH